MKLIWEKKRFLLSLSLRDAEVEQPRIVWDFQVTRSVMEGMLRLEGPHPVPGQRRQRLGSWSACVSTVTPCGSNVYRDSRRPLDFCFSLWHNWLLTKTIDTQMAKPLRFLHLHVCACVLRMRALVGGKCPGKEGRPSKTGRGWPDSPWRKRHNCLVPLVKQVTTALRQDLLCNTHGAQDLSGVTSKTVQIRTSRNKHQIVLKQCGFRMRPMGVKITVLVMISCVALDIFLKPTELSFPCPPREMRYRINVVITAMVFPCCEISHPSSASQDTMQWCFGRQHKNNERLCLWIV